VMCLIARLAYHRTRKAALGLPSCVGLMLAALSLESGIAGQRAEHRIVIAAPLSGHMAALGRDIAAAARLAADDINAAGGVSGEMIALDVKDDGCGSATAATLANTLAPLPNAATGETTSSTAPIRAIVGHPCTPGALAAAPIYAARTDALVFVTGVTNPRLTTPRAGPHIFRVAPLETPMGVFMGEHIAAAPPTTRTAVIYDRSIRSLGVIQAAQKTLGALGHPPVLVENYGSGDKDFTSVAARMAAAGITRVGLAAYPAEAALLITELRAAIPTLRITATDTLAGPETAALARGALDGVEIVMQPDVRFFPDTSDLAQRLATHGATPSRAALASYVALRIWADAARAAGSVDPKMVAARLQSMTFQTPLGAFAFTAKGDSSLPSWAVYTWRKGVLGR
jgi:branched-chain amino acid transport system substrate-binding protein